MASLKPNFTHKQSMMNLRMNLQILVDIYDKTVQKGNKNNPRRKWGELFDEDRKINTKRVERIRFGDITSALRSTEVNIICKATDIPHEYFQEINNNPIQLITTSTNFSGKGDLKDYLEQIHISKEYAKTPKEQYYNALSSLVNDLEEEKVPKNSPVFLAYYFYKNKNAFSSTITKQIDSSMQFINNIISDDWKKCNDADLKSYCNSFDALSKKLRAYLLCKEEKFF